MLTTSSDQPAKLHYGPNSFRVLRSGRFVTCAVTGEPIPLDTLRYWSVERQEAYRDADAVFEREKQVRAAGR